ncbi:MAG: TonB-dependent receptor plug domain-containing protein, partial [Bacteroidia bacterium]|nr:TonB-dependent receptor plug domain-containing protein [Bacteroidia bacterium]
YIFSKLEKGEYKVWVTRLGYLKIEKNIKINTDTTIIFVLQENPAFTQEIVVSGTLYPISKTDSPTPVEVYNQSFFQSNPTTNVFEALQNANGVRPQLNCSVCGTGDIRVNGLEGPYTMILIDGMPIVSGLAAVYGLMGIPTDLIERVEIIKGPNSTLYGSEAVGGVVNIITKCVDKCVEKVPKLSLQAFSSTWQDLNLDVGLKTSSRSNISNLVGISYFHYQRVDDRNKDNFTDIPLQNRISLFDKITFENKASDEIFTLVCRYIYEDRWGGQTQWQKKYRATDIVYGESIYTNRVEWLGNLYLPRLKNKVKLQFSSTYHHQNSAYGTLLFIAKQDIHFVQLLYQNRFKKHYLTSGTSYRYTFYDDNTWATQEHKNALIYNKPILTSLPGIFWQDECKLNTQNTLLVGLRYDFHNQHKHIFSPRIAYQRTSKSKKHTVRSQIANGFRVVNVFTEDHAALSGARSIIITSQLKPETSWNIQTQYAYKNYLHDRHTLNLELNAFYTYFGNKIIPDYTNPQKIIYDNLRGYAVSRGINLSFNMVYDYGLFSNIGFTLQDVYIIENHKKKKPLLTETYSAVWTIRYQHRKYAFTIDYTGSLYGPMKLPLLSPLDTRPEYSPVWTLQNIQFSKKWKKPKEFEVFGGVKNLLNFVPPVYSIARPHDPFNKNVLFDSQGNVVPTPDNPQALTFDTSYIFAPNQGRRFFLGLRIVI